MSKKINTLLVGEGFVSWQKKCKAFHDPNVKTTQLLLKWLGLEHKEFKKLFKTANVITYEGGMNEELSSLVNSYKRIIILGRVAEKRILGVTGITPRITFSEKGNIVIYVLPHPSGKNRILNDKKVRRACEELCEGITKKVKREYYGNGKKEG